MILFFIKVNLLILTEMTESFKMTHFLKNFIYKIIYNLFLFILIYIYRLTESTELEIGRLNELNDSQRCSE